MQSQPQLFQKVSENITITTLVIGEVLQKQQRKGSVKWPGFVDLE